MVLFWGIRSFDITGHKRFENCEQVGLFVRYTYKT